MSSIYEGLVICNPREYCSTWDFCTHYIPHIKSVACSCDSCEPCDFNTVVEHRKRPIAARDKWWVEQIEKFIGTCLRLESSGLSTCDDCGDQPYQCPMYEMALLKREVGQ